MSETSAAREPHNLDINSSVEPCASSRLIAAVIAGNYAAVRDLISLGVSVNPSCVYFRDNFYETTTFENMSPLCIAALLGNARMVKLLLEAGADTGCTSDGGLTPLLRAISWKRVKCFHALANNSDLYATDDQGANALMIACGGENPRVVKYLIRRKFPLDCKCSRGLTALHIVSEPATLGFNAEIIKLLVRAGAKNLPDGFGVTPAISAARYGQQSHLLNAARFSDDEHASCELVSIFSRLTAPVLPRRNRDISAFRATFCAALEKYDGQYFEFLAQRPYQHLKQLLCNAGFSEVTTSSAPVTVTCLFAQSIIQLERFLSACSVDCIRAVELLINENSAAAAKLLLALLEETSQNALMSTRNWYTYSEFVMIADLAKHITEMGSITLSDSLDILQALFDVCASRCVLKCDANFAIQKTIKVLVNICRCFPHLTSCRTLADKLLQFHVRVYNASPGTSVYHRLLQDCRSSPVNLLRLVIGEIPNINFVDEHGCTLLNKACRREDVYSLIIRELLKRPDIDVDIPDNDGNSPLTAVLKPELHSAIESKRGLQCLAACSVARNFTDPVAVPRGVRHMIAAHRERQVFQKAHGQKKSKFILLNA